MHMQWSKRRYVASGPSMMLATAFLQAQWQEAWLQDSFKARQAPKYNTQNISYFARADTHTAAAAQQWCQVHTRQLVSQAANAVLQLTREINT